GATRSGPSRRPPSNGRRAATEARDRKRRKGASADAEAPFRVPGTSPAGTSPSGTSAGSTGVAHRQRTRRYVLRRPRGREDVVAGPLERRVQRAAQDRVALDARHRHGGTRRADTSDDLL